MKLTVEVPLGVQGVVERPGCEDLSSHGHLTVRVTFPCSRQRRAQNTKIKQNKERITQEY